MAKSSTYLLRLDPQKKALWESKSREQDMSLAKWIEMMCDRGDPSSVVEIIQPTTTLTIERIKPPKTGVSGHKGFQNGSIWVCDQDCPCRG